MTRIRELCKDHPGFQEIILVLQDGEDKKPVRLPFRVDASDELTKPLSDLLTADCVKVV
ncbi:hypothetical protein J6S39_01200 [Candidatus Saccharibacteria bacterium]|nr:hypothetical protein [Candidatus Saccharibacteria bacterium]